MKKVTRFFVYWFAYWLSAFAVQIVAFNGLERGTASLEEYRQESTLFVFLLIFGSLFFVLIGGAELIAHILNYLEKKNEEQN